MTVQRLSSTRFRRAYPRIEGPVEVTALGRVIGTWLPAGGTVTLDIPPMPSATPEPPPSGAPEKGSKGGTTDAYRKYAASLKEK